MDPQYFNENDPKEKKFDDAASPTLDALSLQADLFYEGAYECFALGDVLYDSGRAPLANAIDRAIYREAFSTIFAAFLVAGTYESYITVFKNIFGDDVVLEFDSPAPGKLLINIEAAGTQIKDLLVRRVVDNAYEYDELMDREGNNIAVRSPKGFKTQYETEQMLFEMVPGGVYTEISLTIAS